MGNKLYEENSISAIASAIRNKLDTETLYKVNEMAGAINSIPKASGTTNIVENGYHDVTAYAQAYVNVPGSVPTGKINITENGTNIDVAQYATADVQVPQPIGKTTITQNGTDINIAQYAVADVIVQPNVDSKTINQNGVYNASSDNLDGYSQVTVNGFTPSYIKNPIEFDYDNGYVESTGKWTYQYPSNNYLDIYTVENGKHYRICYGSDMSNRARGILTETDVRTLHEGETATGSFVGTTNSFTIGASWSFTSSIDGYLVFQKSSNSTSGIPTYLFCIEDMNNAEPSGTKSITQNGQGIDVAGYSAVNVNVPTVPSTWSLSQITISEDAHSVTIPYDSSRNPYAVMLIPNTVEYSRYEYLFYFAKRSYSHIENDDMSFNQLGSVAMNNSHNDDSIVTGSNTGTVDVDTENHTITLNVRSDTFWFKAGDVFDLIIMYITNQNEGI